MYRFIIQLLILNLFLCLNFGCNISNNRSDQLIQQFTKLSSGKTGITFQNTLQENNNQNILTYEYFYNGGGVAVGDINNDGLVDIYLSANQEENKLYLNKGDFRFEDITEKAGVSTKSGWRTGVTMIDINHDGYLDIYVCRSGEVHPMIRENTLFINNKDLTFSKAAQQYGLNDDSYSTTSAFFDYDRDGDLDMFLLNHSRLPLSNSYDIAERYKNDRVEYVGNKLYRNDKDKFVDVSDSLGIYGPVSNYGLGVALADINNDGWMDLYTTNDYTEKDKFYINKEGRFFDEVSDSLLTHMSQSSMGLDIADVNNDGLMDIFVLDMLPQSNKHQKTFYWPDSYDVYASMVDNGLHHQYMRNTLQLNNGNGTFSEIGQLAGVSNTEWSWSALFADYNNDGLQDLFVSNGFMRNFTSHDFLNDKNKRIHDVKQGNAEGNLKDILESVPAYITQNYMFKNENGIKFNDVSGQWGFDHSNLSNGAAYADLDNDGDLDLIINNINEEAGIYRNNAESSGNNYLKVHLRGSNKNTFGLGSKVILYYENEKMKTRTLSPYRGFQSSVEPALFFGLGSVITIDSLVVQWPTGEIQTVENIKPNQTITVYQKNAGTSNIMPHITSSEQFFAKNSQVIDFKHNENSFVDFKSQRLLPRMYSTEGPAMASGDVNNDGLLDVYIGGAKGQAGALILQNKDQSYIRNFQTIFSDHDSSEEVDAVFFDMEGDGDLDLYVVAGGYEYQENDHLLQDRLYRNDGKGNFTKAPLPQFYTSGSCVEPADIDGDGDLDLFVGGRIIPTRYPETPTSHILINDGSGDFSIATKQLAPSLSSVGMVTEASWTDLNNDGQPDLLVVGEWMPVSIFINEGGKLEEKSGQYFDMKTEGWWSSLVVDDFDDDGDPDFVAGNYGLNNQFKAEPEKPVTIYYSDYDNNGSVDPIMNYFIGENSYPSPTHDELMKQCPSFSSRFNDYESYSRATIDSILTKEELEQSNLLRAYTFETCYFQNDKGKFKMKPLPVMAQVAPVMAMISSDVNSDGHMDLITAGNISKTRYRFGKATGNFGSVFLGNGNGEFEYVPYSKSGLKIKGDTRAIIKNENTFIFAVNDDYPQLYKMVNQQVVP